MKKPLKLLFAYIVVLVIVILVIDKEVLPDSVPLWTGDELIGKSVDDLYTNYQILKNDDRYYFYTSDGVKVSLGHTPLLKKIDSYSVNLSNANDANEILKHYHVSEDSVKEYSKDTSHIVRSSKYRHVWVWQTENSVILVVSRS